MSNKKVDLLKRRNKGKAKLKLLARTFISSGFDKNDLIFLTLEKTDKIIEKIRTCFSQVPAQNETLLGGSTGFEDSNLLSDIMCSSVHDNSRAYIFTDDYQYCGICITSSKKAFKHALDIAKNDYQNTCFLLDENFHYSFRINYYDEDHNDDPNTFDIQRKVKTANDFRLI